MVGHDGEEFVALIGDMIISDMPVRLDESCERLAVRNSRNRNTDEPIGAIIFSGGIPKSFSYPDVRAATR
jgi:hypothetical protein